VLDNNFILSRGGVAFSSFSGYATALPYPFVKSIHISRKSNVRRIHRCIAYLVQGKPELYY
jgi:hypothetical protein